MKKFVAVWNKMSYNPSRHDVIVTDNDVTREQVVEWYEQKYDQKEGVYNKGFKARFVIEETDECMSFYVKDPEFY